MPKASPAVASIAKCAGLHQHSLLIDVPEDDISELTRGHNVPKILHCAFALTTPPYPSVFLC